MARTRELRIRLRALDRISKTLDRVRKRFPKLSRAVRRASRTFQIFNARTKKVRQALTRMGSTMSRVGSKLTRGVTLPVAFAGAAILRVGVNFQRAINKVGAITRTIIDGKVTPAFIALKKQALLLGKTTEFSSTQTANAMVFLGRAGFSANEILETTDDVLALASASGMDLAFSANVLAKTIRQFGLEAKDATRVTDVLADVSRRTNVDLETISETFKTAAPIAKAYGATLEQTAAITGLLGDVGLQGTVAGTALKNIFLKLAAPSKRATDILTAMGVAVTTVDGKMRSAGEILTEMGPLLGKLNKNKQLEALNELFGLRGIAGASALMSRAIAEGKDPIAELTETLKGSAGAAKEMQKIMLRGSVGAIAKFNSALEGVGLAFAESGLLDAFTKVLILLADMFSALSSLSPVILNTIVIIAAIGAAIGPIIFVIGKFVAGVALIIKVLVFLKAVAVVVGAVIAGLSIPVLLIVAAIAAVVAIVVRLITKWGALVRAFKSGKGVFDTIGKVSKTFLGIGGGGEESGGQKPLTRSARFGTAIGAQRSLNKPAPGINSSSERTNNAAVSIELKGFPRATKVKSQVDDASNFNLGFLGGVQ